MKLWVDDVRPAPEAYMADKVQARIHKKNRINKKWRKRYGMRDVPWNKLFVEGNRIYCHPKMFDKIKAAIDNK